MLTRRNFLERLVQVGVVGGIIETTLFSPQTAAQEEGTALRHDRMSKIEALGRIDRANMAIPNLSAVFKEGQPEIKDPIRDPHAEHTVYEVTEEETPEFQTIKRNISEVLTQCDDREALYKANFLMARLMFDFNRTRTRASRSLAGNSKWFKEIIEGRMVSDDAYIGNPVRRLLKGRGFYYDFSDTWDYIERTIIEFSEQEEKFGLGFGGLEKMSDAFFEIMKDPNDSNKEVVKSFLDISRCYELANEYSKYPQKDMTKLKRNLDNYLDIWFNPVNLGKVLEFMFPETVVAAQECWTYDSWKGYEDRPMDLQRELKNDRLYFITETGRYYMTAWSNELRDVKITLDLGKSRPFPNLCFNLIKLNKVKFNETLKYNPGDEEIFYKIENRLSTPFEEILIKQGVKIRDFLRKGGVNPYDWCYNKSSQTKTATELGGEKW